MSRKRHTPEQIIGKLREAEVLLSQGRTAPEARKQIGISEQTYYRWRKEYGGLRLDQAKRVRSWLSDLGVKTLFIERGSPWERDYVESFIGKLRDEMLNREVFYTLDEAKVLVELWRQEYNRVRPHSALGYRPPAPEAIEPWPPGLAPLGSPAMASFAERLS